MAKLKKRADGRYAATAQVNGKRKYFYAKTQSAANAARDKFLANNKVAVNFDDSITLNAWYEQWKIAKKPTIAASTYESYTSYIERYITPVLGNYKLTDFTVTGLRSFIVKLSESGLSARTVEYVHTLLKSMFTMAVDDEILAKNPMSKIKPPKKQPTREMVTLTSNQITEFLNVITNSEHKMFFKLAFASGLRRSELLGLRWSDVNFKNSTISVNQTGLKVSGHAIISQTTKNATSKRTISIDSVTMTMLKSHKAVVDKRRLKHFHWINNDLVFPGQKGNPRNPDDMSKLARKYSLAIGVEGFTMHCTRHTHATLLIEAGVHFKVIQTRLGHATFEETMNTYGHVTSSMKMITNDLLEKVF